MLSESPAAAADTGATVFASELTTVAKLNMLAWKMAVEVRNFAVQNRKIQQEIPTLWSFAAHNTVILNVSLNCQREYRVGNEKC